MRSLIALAIVLSITVALLIGLALLLAGLGSEAAKDDALSLEPLTIVTLEGNVARLQIEVADTTEERSVGLSGREEIPDGTGMLFVLPTRGPGFWMKDTPAPLSIAFLARCGEILDIQHMEPLSLEMHTTAEDYHFALEVRQGWFGENDVQVGDIVSIPRDHRPDGC